MAKFAPKREGATAPNPGIARRNMTGEWPGIQKNG